MDQLLKHETALELFDRYWPRFFLARCLAASSRASWSSFAGVVGVAGAAGPGGSLRPSLVAGAGVPLAAEVSFGGATIGRAPSSGMLRLGVRARCLAALSRAIDPSRPAGEACGRSRPRTAARPGANSPRR